MIYLFYFLTDIRIIIDRIVASLLQLPLYKEVTKYV